MAKRKLGRGLEMLLGKDGGDVPTRTGSDRKKQDRAKSPREKAAIRKTSKEKAAAGVKPAGAGAGDQVPVVLLVSPDEIRENPQQPRKDFPMAELEALKTSVSRDGLL